MDPMSALAIVALVFQLTDLGGKLLSKGISIYRDGQGKLDELRILQDQISSVSGTLRSMRGSPEDGDPALDPQLLQLIQNCEELALEVRKMLPDNAKGLSRALRNGKDVDALKKKLEGIKSVTTDTILLSMWESNKHREKREMEFGNQIAELLSLIKNLDGAASRVVDGASSAADAVRGLVEDFGLVASSNGMEALVKVSLANPGLGQQLAKQIWHQDWKPESFDDSKMAQTGTSTASLNSVAAMAAARLKFGSSQTREAAVSDTILQTYSWIYQHHVPPSQRGWDSWSSFPEWLEDKSQPISQPIYWITGKAGSGKSTIMKHILRSPALQRHLGRWAGSLPLVVVRYYAWHAGATLQKSLQGMKRTVLFQALTFFPQLVPHVAPRVWAFHAILQSPTSSEWAVLVPNLEEWEVDESFNALLSMAEDKICLAIFVDGLDEFDVAPEKVVELVESLTNPGRRVKVCVTSRPWIQFDDAYRTVPKLRMHLHTASDMEVFVAETIRPCIGFADLRKAYPAETAKLLLDLTDKANGVFIWLKVVTQNLIQAVTDGISIRDVQEILASLPSDIRDLYDSLWDRMDRMPERNRKQGAVLLRLSTTRFWPLSWTEAWLADEYAVRDFDITQERVLEFQNLPPSQDSGVAHIGPLLRRRLISRTRGLLELTEDRRVGFTHRTAYDWAQQPATQDKMKDICGEHCRNPHIFFAQLLTLQATCPALCPEPRNEFWVKIVIRTLQIAGETPLRSQEETRLFVRTLDTFDHRCGAALGSPEHHPAAAPEHHWACFSDASLNPTSGERRWRHNTFIGLAAQFHILAYLSAKAEQDPLSLRQKGTREVIGLFESAVLGHEFFAKVQDPSNPPQDHSKGPRLETVQFLIKLGLEQPDTFFAPARGGWEDHDSLRQLVLDFISWHRTTDRLPTPLATPAQLSYYEDVAKILAPRGGLFFYTRRGTRRLLWEVQKARNRKGAKRQAKRNVLLSGEG